MRGDIPSPDDIEAIWFGHGCELARLMKALADQFENLDPVDGPMFAELIREVLHTDYNPLPAGRPELGDPPTLRPAIPPNHHAGRGVATEPGS